MDNVQIIVPSIRKGIFLCIVFIAEGRVKILNFFYMKMKQKIKTVVTHTNISKDSDNFVHLDNQPNKKTLLPATIRKPPINGSREMLRVQQRATTEMMKARMRMMRPMIIRAATACAHAARQQAKNYF